MITAELYGGPLDGHVQAIDDDPVDPGLVLSFDHVDHRSQTITIEHVLYLRQRLPVGEGRWRYRYRSE